jgi:hypothetical protein
LVLTLQYSFGGAYQKASAQLEKGQLDIWGITHIIYPLAGAIIAL